jgi:hypothetical protein
MSETQSGAMAGESAVDSIADSGGTNDSGSTTEDPSDDEQAYEAELTASVTDIWQRPGRDSNTAPRIARVLVRLGPNGRVQSWEWRRRSPHTLFNDELATYLDRLVDGNRRFPMPPEGSPLRRRVLRDGVVVEFADDDA